MKSGDAPEIPLNAERLLVACAACDLIMDSSIMDVGAFSLIPMMNAEPVTLLAQSRSRRVFEESPSPAVHANH